MPMDRLRYPADWLEVVRRAAALAGGRCQCRGECGHDHGAEQPHGDTFPPDPRCWALHGEAHPITGSIVVLTTAHLWRGPCAEHHRTGVKCGEASHLAVYCQRCHLAYDGPHHRAARRKTIRAQRAAGDFFEP